MTIEFKQMTNLEIGGPVERNVRRAQRPLFTIRGRCFCWIGIKLFADVLRFVANVA